MDDAKTRVNTNDYAYVTDIYTYRTDVPAIGSQEKDTLRMS
jgi:hypothetical protein